MCFLPNKGEEMKGISKKFILFSCVLFVFNSGLFADANDDLHRSVITNDFNTFKERVDKALSDDAQINVKRGGMTVLHAAALESHSDLEMWKNTIKYLVGDEVIINGRIYIISNEEKANPNLTIVSSDAWNGLKPWQVAKKCFEDWKNNKYKEIANYLAEKAGDPKPYPNQ